MKTTEQMPPRPIFTRYLIRKHCLSMPMDPPSRKEVKDAYRVLRECDPPVYDIDELLVGEAQRTLSEAGHSIPTHDH